MIELCIYSESALNSLSNRFIKQKKNPNRYFGLILSILAFGHFFGLFAEGHLVAGVGSFII